MEKLYHNKSLFSNHYLDKLLPGEKEWGIETGFYFKEIKGLYEANKERLPGLNESQLRKHFLDKVLEILGWTVDVEPPTPSGEWAKHPDYALFKDKENLRSAQSLSEEGYFSKAACVGEAKRWGRPLDRRLKSEQDLFEIQNPSLQMSRYLWLAGVKWGVLTDGRYWRLYERETSKRLDIYYEIDLASLLEDGTEGNFKYFCLFFRKESFHEFVNKVYQGSVDYAREVGEELKGNVYQALKLLAEGFLKTPGNDLSQEDLKDIHNNSLILLYRLLFVLYAEYRDLLPLDKNRFYTESYSLDTLKKEIVPKLDRRTPIATSTYHYWSRLKELFEVINSGNSELEVPPYNGGLFNPAKHKFLERCRAGDLYIARAIDLLTRSQDKAFIDYSSLEVRHLGSIYEGLLEYKLRIADQDLVSVKEKGKEIYVPLDEAEKNRKKIKKEEIVREGEAYLVTDKGERKASGSYYTPDYIVNYIIENTLGPLCKQITDRIRDEVHKLEEKVKGSRGQNREIYQRKLEEIKTSFDDEVLKLKVLDPAMGSGHFLVRATEYLAEEVATNPYAWDEEAPEGEAAVSFYKRRIVENCIYGVDLNPLSVELAKLSLWLSTVAKNRPLNFLDHHLRCGNSLIGAKVEDLSNLPDLRKKRKKAEAHAQIGLFESVFKEKVYLLLGAFEQIEHLPSNTVEQIDQKEKLYQGFRKTVDRFCDVADVWTSIYFGSEVGWDDYYKLQENLRAKEEEWQTLMASHPCFKQAKEIACDKHFFHWELEFPEVFFEGSRYKDNPGFDCVVGNPPYYTLTLGKKQRQADEQELSFFKMTYKHSAEYKMNLFALFSEKALKLLIYYGQWSFILPNTLLTNYYLKNLRKWISTNFHLREILDLRYRVFEEAEIGGNALIFVQAIPLKENTKQTTSLALVGSAEEFLITSQFQNIFPQSTFEYLPDYKFLTDPNTIKLFLHVQKNCVKLGEVATIYQGIITGNNKKFIANKKVSSKYKKILRGENIDKYSLSYNENYILYDPKELWSNTDPAMFLVPSKIISRQTSDHLAATIDTDQYFTLDSTHVIHSNINHFFLLTIFNSRLLNFLYQQIVPEEGKTFAQVKAINLKQLPIRRINFTTPESERKRLSNNLTTQYKTAQFNQILIQVEECLPKDKEGNFISDQEKSDVIHDFLAFLAEQMIEMNKEKQAEIRNFFSWLKDVHSIDKDVLKPKTYLNKFYKLESGDLFKHLERNKIKPNSTDYSQIKEAFEESIRKLRPLIQRIETTDRLIDQVVYKLYDLTEEEIKIVEGK